jgi:hypothetical protein
MKKACWIFWILVCFIGSITHSYLFVKETNADGAFYLDIFSFSFIFLILFVLSFSLTAPLVIIFKQFYKNYNKIKRHFLILNLILLFYIGLFLIIITLGNFLDISDSFELITPYGIIGCLAVNLYEIIHSNKANN